MCQACLKFSAKETSAAGQELLARAATSLDRPSGRDERPESLIGPQLGLIVVVTMECVARYAALVHPARCVEITKIDKHAHRRRRRHGIPLPIVERHGIDHRWATADLITDRD